jgi:hypothetical protein
MPRRELSCPVCDAELLFGGDERRGDVIICSYCGAPFTVQKAASDEDEWEIEDDY